MYGYEFVTARFTDNARNTVEALWTRTLEDGTVETVPEYIEAKLNSAGEAVITSPQWEKLLTHIDIDGLHENTGRFIDEQRLQYEDAVIVIARKRGMIYEVDSINSNMYKSLAETIFKTFSEEDDKEKLFMLKLQMFELDVVKASKDRETKAKLRKATNMIEAIKWACVLHEKPIEE